MVASGQRAVVGTVRGFQRSPRVNITRGSAFPGDLFQRQAFDMKLAVVLREKRHGFVASGDFFASVSLAGAATGGVAPGFWPGK